MRRRSSTHRNSKRHGRFFGSEKTDSDYEGEDEASSVEDNSLIYTKSPQRRKTFAILRKRRAKRNQCDDESAMSEATGYDDDDGYYFSDNPDVKTPHDDKGQTAAEALVRDLENMGYDLSCDTFFTKKTSGSDAKDERYAASSADPRLRQRYDHVDSDEEDDAVYGADYDEVDSDEEENLHIHSIDFRSDDEETIMRETIAVADAATTSLDKRKLSNIEKSGFTTDATAFSTSDSSANEIRSVKSQTTNTPAKLKSNPRLYQKQTKPKELPEGTPHSHPTRTEEEALCSPFIGGTKRSPSPLASHGIQQKVLPEQMRPPTVERKPTEQDVQGETAQKPQLPRANNPRRPERSRSLERIATNLTKRGFLPQRNHKSRSPRQKNNKVASGNFSSEIFTPGSTCLGRTKTSESPLPPRPPSPTTTKPGSEPEGTGSKPPSQQHDSSNQGPNSETSTEETSRRKGRVILDSIVNIVKSIPKASVAGSTVDAEGGIAVGDDGRPQGLTQSDTAIELGTQTEKGEEEIDLPDTNQDDLNQATLREPEATDENEKKPPARSRRSWLKSSDKNKLVNSLSLRSTNKKEDDGTPAAACAKSRSDVEEDKPRNSAERNWLPSLRRRRTSNDPKAFEKSLASEQSRNEKIENNDCTTDDKMVEEGEEACSKKPRETQQQRKTSSPEESKLAIPNVQSMRLSSSEKKSSMRANDLVMSPTHESMRTAYDCIEVEEEAPLHARKRSAMFPFKKKQSQHHVKVLVERTRSMRGRCIEGANSAPAAADGNLDIAESRTEPTDNVVDQHNSLNEATKPGQSSSDQLPDRSQEQSAKAVCFTTEDGASAIEQTESDEAAEVSISKKLLPPTHNVKSASNRSGDVSIVCHPPRPSDPPAPAAVKRAEVGRKLTAESVAELEVDANAFSEMPASDDVGKGDPTETPAIPHASLARALGTLVGTLYGTEVGAACPGANSQPLVTPMNDLVLMDSLAMKSSFGDATYRSMSIAGLTAAGDRTLPWGKKKTTKGGFRSSTPAYGGLLSKTQTQIATSLGLAGDTNAPPGENADRAGTSNVVAIPLATTEQTANDQLVGNDQRPNLLNLGKIPDQLPMSASERIPSTVAYNLQDVDFENLNHGKSSSHYPESKGMLSPLTAVASWKSCKKEKKSSAEESSTKTAAKPSDTILDQLGSLVNYLHEEQEDDTIDTRLSRYRGYEIGSPANEPIVEQHEQPEQKKSASTAAVSVKEQIEAQYNPMETMQQQQQKQQDSALAEAAVTSGFEAEKTDFLTGATIFSITPTGATSAGVSGVTTTTGSDEETWARMTRTATIGADGSASFLTKTDSYIDDDFTDAADVLEALLTLRRHAARLGINEADLLAAAKSYDLDVDKQRPSFGEEMFSFLNTYLNPLQRQQKG